MKIFLLPKNIISIIKNPKFSRDIGTEFSNELKNRVNHHFKSNDISKYGNNQMIIKSVVMLLLFFIPITFISIGLVTSPWLLFLLYMTSGVGMAGIGMGVMHDAIHGSYSRNQKINRIMGYSFNLIGANANVWKIQHNVLHHTYTNIDESDDDIHTPFFLRFSPHAKLYWIHRFQYLYVWFFYGVSTIAWITAKDFVKLSRYNKLGLIKGSKFREEIVKIAAWKLVYYSYALVLPLIMVPLASWIIILAFVTMHFITGVMVSVVFQTAHVMPKTDFPLPDNDGLIANNWTIHQLVTTSNFAPKSKFLYWMIGGLNYQVEHHLFPNICHIHYKRISSIVEKTAKEFGIPYLSKKTFIAAIVDHTKMLYQLGRMQPNMAKLNY